MRSPLSPLCRALGGFDRWVREPVDPRPMARFRCWFGLLTLVNLAFVWHDMPMWLGDAGVLPPAVHRLRVADTRASLFLLTGYDDAAIGWIRGLGVVGGLGLVTGIMPRAAAACVWLASASLCWRNPLILHSGDSLIRIGSFFLIFAHTGGCLSLPRGLRRLWAAGPARDAGVAKVPAWPRRILQVQLCVLYLVAGIWKLSGPSWRDGTAVGMVLQLGEFQRFPIPDLLMTPAMSRAMSYGTLAFELGFPLLVWVPRLRVPVLLAGLAFHAGLDWVMNVQLFQWLITSFYLLWLEPRPPAAPAADPAPMRPGGRPRR